MVTTCTRLVAALTLPRREWRVGHHHSASLQVLHTRTDDVCYSEDAATAGQKLGLVSKTKEAEKTGAVAVADVGKKIDDGIASARDAGNKVDNKLEAYRRDAEAKIESARKEAGVEINKAGTELNKAVDSFDKNVTEGAAKAKSGIGSWFGGK